MIRFSIDSCGERISMNPPPLPTVYQWLRLNFGDKPAPDIASNAIKILAKASQVEFPEAAKELEERTYVDGQAMYRGVQACNQYH